jgi:neutral ceramidase
MNVVAGDLRAGAARRTINPRLGTGKGGLRLFGDPIQAIESDLTASAVVLADDRTQVVLLALDLCVVSPREATSLRAAVAGALAIPTSHVLLNVSHNHASPALSGFMWMTDRPEEAAMRERYAAQLEAAILEAALDAASALAPARVGTGWGESRIGVYRREFHDATGVLGEVPDHPIDSSLAVVRIDDLDGRALATLFRFSAHPVTVGPRSFVASADYPGPARAVVEHALGGLAVFLQGCGGNVNPAVGIGYEVDCRDTKDRVGTQLGGEALAIAAATRTHRRAGPRTTFGDVPGILAVAWQDVDGHPCHYLGAVEETLELEFGELPSVEEAQAIHAHWERTLQERIDARAAEWQVRVAKKYRNWSRILVEAAGHPHPTCAIAIQALRVNDLVIVGIPAEVFFETGLLIRQRSPFPDTLVLGYTNGIVGYLPREEDYPSGGWRLDERYALPDMIPQAWELPVAFRDDSAARTADFAVSLIERLAGMGGPSG